MAFPANFDKCNSAKFLEKEKNEPSVKSYFFCELSDIILFWESIQLWKQRELRVSVAGQKLSSICGDSVTVDLNACYTNQIDVTNLTWGRG